MAVTHKSAISFGLVAILIAMYTADTERGRFSASDGKLIVGHQRIRFRFCISESSPI